MLDDLKAWGSGILQSRPFGRGKDTDLLHVFLLMGLLVAMSIGWGLILSSIRRASA